MCSSDLGNAINRIEESCIKEIVALNTIPSDRLKDSTKFRTLSVAPVFAKAIERIYKNRPISSLNE